MNDIEIHSGSASVKDIEIPFGIPTREYRAFEMLPAALSYGAIVLLVALSIFDPRLGAFYLIAVVGIMFVRSMFMLRHMFRGMRLMEAAMRVDWSARLRELERMGPVGTGPDPARLRHAVIVAAYNESMEVLEPTLRSVAETSFENERIMVVLAYEERGGAQIAATAEELRRRFAGVFGDFLLVRHPDGLSDELPGKGSNISWAGRCLQTHLDKQGIPYEDVIVTTLDSDNRPHPAYFDYVACEYLVREDRERVSYQPIAMFTSNIWHVPAPARVVGLANSFWNVMSSARPKLLRNFASHSQPMSALVSMGFWSTRTVVEDGHQYWRSYFHFDGDYSVVPISLPMYQDAVLTDGLRRTLIAQFKQLRRWAYGASDIPYAAVRLFGEQRRVPFNDGLVRFLRLVDGHVTWACIPVLILFGPWLPLIAGRLAGHPDEVMWLPQLVGAVQTVGMAGLLASVLLTFRVLPPRPALYGPGRTVAMAAQWVLMPVIGLVYNSLSAYTAQTLLFTGQYMATFDVTEKATVAADSERVRASIGGSS